MKALLHRAHPALRPLANGMILCLLSLALTRADAQWTQTTSLPDGYYGHSLAYASGFLYQAGGVSNLGGIADAVNVFFAQVHSNGTIGTWNVTTTLPEYVHYHAGVAANGFLYVLGGDAYIDPIGLFATNVVFYSKINTNGSLGAWQTTTPMPHSVYLFSAAAWNGRIYAVGGWDDTNLINAVWSAQIQSDGSLSSWVAQTPVPVPGGGVYGHAAVANGALYVLGGLINGGSEISGNVYYSRINVDGTLAGWNQTTPLPQPICDLPAVAAGGRVFVMAGNGNSGPLNACYNAPVGGDGSLGSWSSCPPLPKAEFSFGAAASDSHIFVSGGTQDSNIGTSSVYSMPLPPPPTAPALAQQRFGTNGAFQLQLTSTTNTGFGIQASTNLADWTLISWGFTGTNGLLFFQDTNAAQFPRRFYRAYWPLP